MYTCLNPHLVYSLHSQRTTLTQTRVKMYQKNEGPWCWVKVLMGVLVEMPGSTAGKCPSHTCWWECRLTQLPPTHTHWNKVVWLHQLPFLACCVLAQLDFTINFWTFHSQLNLLLLFKKVLESFAVWIFLEIRADVGMYQIVSIVLGCQMLILKAISWY